MSRTDKKALLIQGSDYTSVWKQRTSFDGII